MTFSVENFTRVYDDETGYYVEVRPDRDAGTLVEVQANEGEHSYTPLVMKPEQAKLLGIALCEAARKIEQADREHSE